MNRIDLECQINNFLNVADDIDILLESLKKEEISSNEAADILKGISGLIKLRHAQLFDTIKVVFKLDEYAIEKAFI